MKPFYLPIALAAVTFAAPVVLLANATRLKDAETVLVEMAGSKDSGIPSDLIKDARCIVVLPGVKRGAFGFGVQYGRGYMSCRIEGAGASKWSAPASVRIEGGSFGLQIGGSETDVILIVRNQKGVDRLLSSQFTVGADATVAAGPVGRQAAAETDATLRAEMLAYSHSRGVFAGAALQGSTLREDRDENQALYGPAMTNREIVAGKAQAPADAQSFVAALARY